jgi:hypothetical protein
LRWALTEAVHSHLRYDAEFTRFYKRLTLKKPGQVATTATVWKMLKFVHPKLKAGEPFQL